MSRPRARLDTRAPAHALWLRTIIVFVALLLAAPSLARADDIEDFQAARALYEAHDWPNAIRAFEALVGGDTPHLSSQPLVLESRQYLAAAYVFVGRERAAADQLERLLSDEPTYELDATQFPRDVVQLFERVQTRQRDRREAEAERERLAAEVVRLTADNTALRERLDADHDVEVPRTQSLMFIPFGVGQFENGEEGLGWFFAITEALALGGAVVCTILHLAYVALIQDNSSGFDASDWAQVNAALDVIAPLNWSLLGTFGVLGIAGVVQANVAFTPTRSVRIPGAAGEPSLPEPTVSLRLSPTFVGITGTF